MKISRLNYEMFFLDYHEGNLSEEQVSALMSFLEQNPDLKAELESFEMIELELEEDDIKFPNKSLLKVPEEPSLPITDNNFDWFCIAHYENDLTLEQESALISYLKEHPEKENDFKLFSETILKADENIVFEKPQTLKRHFATPYVVVKQLWTYASVAAVLLIFAGLFFLMPKQISELETALIEEQSKESPETFKEETIEPEIASTAIPEANQEKKEEKTARIPGQKVKKETKQDSQEIDENMPQPLMASNILVNKDISLDHSQKQTNIKQKPETYTYSGSSNKEDFHSSETANISQSNIEESSSFDIQSIEEGIANRHRLTFWDVAAAGLAGISKLTGNPLTVQKERDQEGKVVELALGDGFSFSRK